MDMQTRRNFIKLGIGSAAALAVSHNLKNAIAGESGKISKSGFPDDFIWGTATSAYQIEGAVNVDGRGPSVWDTFCKKRGVIWQGNTGAVACDHYHRYREDVAMMKELGIKAYRFSISWPRVLPEGRGAANEKGLAFYDRLIDELLQAGIQPACTIFHWDFPEALYQQGGWLNRDVADWFADYTKLVVSRYSDRIKTWITQNEPQCFIGSGLQGGDHAPGLKLKVPDFLTAAHNSLRTHAQAVQVIRATAKNREVQVGYAVVTMAKHPHTESPEDIAAARQAFFEIKQKNAWNNSWWLDPVLEGRYPEDGLKLFGADMPQGFERDLATMRQPLDFLGQNIYSSEAVRADKNGQPETVPWPDGYPRTGTDGQVVTPQCLYWAPRMAYERYKLPIYITENGCTTRDQIFLDGKVHDPQRIDMLNRFLLELNRAVREGIAIKGYFEWSLMDNFEWADGYKQRFGLIYVDYPTQKRIPKDSFYWYKEVIKTNGQSLFGNHVMPVTQVTAAPV